AFLENRDGNIQLKTISAAGGGARAVSSTKGSASHAGWHPKGRALFYLHSTFTRAGRLNANLGGTNRTVVDSLQAKLPKEELADGKLVRYRTFDGRQIPAWLFLPRKDRSRGAALISPHGGPESQTVNEWYIRPEFLVAQGFTVLAPNYRGGTGYGRAWRRLSDQDLGGADTDADRFRKYSPIYFLDSIRAPVLFTGGAHDPRCPVTEARAMVEEMQKMGKTVDYLEFPDEGHSPRKMSNQIRLHERAIEWL